MNETLVQNFQQGNKRCCGNTPEYEIHYKNNETWLVCSNCYNLGIWNQFIKSKTLLNKKCDAS